MSVRSNNCQHCGVNLDLVGRVHHCVTRAAQPQGRDGVCAERALLAPPQRVEALHSLPPASTKVEARTRPATTHPSSTMPFNRAAYYRTYMRDYMRKRRHPTLPSSG